VVSCGSDYKIVVSDVSSLFDDPWTPQLAKDLAPKSSLSSHGRTNDDSFVGSQSSNHPKPPALRYSQTIAHSDYVKKVKCEVSSSGSDLLLFSIGLDAQLKMHVMRPEGGPLVTIQSYNAKTSLYALDISRNNDSWLVATGGADGVVKIFDSREEKKAVYKLKGHTDMIKSLLMPSNRSNIVVSGSSDTSIRIWDLRAIGKAQNCLALHEDSVWDLSEVNVPSNHSTSSHLEFYSGARDGTVYWTDVDTVETRLLFKEPNSILSIAPVNEQSIWISTTDPCITHWELSSINDSNKTGKRPNSITLATSPITSPAALSMSPTGLGNMLEVAQQPATPLLTTQQAISKTPARASLISHHILPDKHRVVTRDNTGRVQVWNVVEMKIENDLGIVQDSIESIVSMLTTKRFLPSWFAAETRSGQLTIHIDPHPRCLDANFTGPESVYKITPDLQRPFENAASNALKRLFKRHIEERLAAEPGLLDKTKQTTVSPSRSPRSPHSPSGSQTPTSNPSNIIIKSEEEEITQPSSKTTEIEEELDVIITVTRENAVLWREHSKNISGEFSIPDWVWKAVTDVFTRPKTPSIGFHFQPTRAGLYRPHDRAFLYQMHRSFTVAGMIDFLVDKRVKSAKTALTRNDVKVYVQNIELPITMDLGTIKHFFWKSSDPIPLEYDFPDTL
jgi:WD40 repeat protein